MIPKEACVIVDINTKSLLSKLPWQEIKKTYWYNKMSTDSSINSSSKIFLDDPAKTGVDLESDILFFILQPHNNGHAVVEGSLKDNKTFSEFIKTMHPNSTMSKDGELNFLKHKDAVVGWNNERFIVVAKADHNIHNEMYDSTMNPVQQKDTSGPDDLMKACKDLFALSSDNSLYENERFAELEKEEGDIHFWMNVNELAKGSMKSMPGMMGMVKLDKFLEDNISTATVNFLDGKITASHKQYFGKELSDILKNGNGNFNADMVKRLPPNLAAAFSLHFSPANILEIIKLTGLDGFINLFMAQQGVSLDDIVKATKGDIVFSVSDVSMSNDTFDIKALNDSMRNYPHKPNATLLFSVSINDKDAFNKLINISKKMGKHMGPKNTFSKTDDKYFAISNTQEAVNKYFSGTTSNPDFLSKINDHPMGGYVDFQMILKALQPEFAKDSTDQFYYNRNVSMWNNLYVSGGAYTNGGVVTNAELNLVDKTTNSLLQLNKYVDDNSKVMIEKRDRQREEWKKDSTWTKNDSIPMAKKKALHKTRK